MRGLRGRLGRMDGTVSGKTALTIAAVGLLVLALGAPRLARGGLPALLGQRATGRAVAVADDPAAEQGDYDRVTVAFTAADGRPVQVERRLSRHQVQGVRRGDLLPVAYFSGSPEGAQVLDRRAEWMGGLGPVILGSLILFVAFVGRPRGGAPPPPGPPRPGKKRRRR